MADNVMIAAFFYGRNELHAPDDLARNGPGSEKEWARIAASMKRYMERRDLQDLERRFGEDTDAYRNRLKALLDPVVPTELLRVERDRRQLLYSWYALWTLTEPQSIRESLMAMALIGLVPDRQRTTVKMLMARLPDEYRSDRPLMKRFQTRLEKFFSFYDLGQDSTGEHLRAYLNPESLFLAREWMLGRFCFFVGCAPELSIPDELPELPAPDPGVTPDGVLDDFHRYLAANVPAPSVLELLPQEPEFYVDLVDETPAASSEPERDEQTPVEEERLNPENGLSTAADGPDTSSRKPRARTWTISCMVVVILILAVATTIMVQQQQEEKSARDLYDQSVTAYEQGAYDRAFRLTDQALERVSDIRLQARLYRIRAEIQFNRNNRDEALTQMRKAQIRLKGAPPDRDLFLIHWRLFLWLSTEEAVHHLQKVDDMIERWGTMEERRHYHGMKSERTLLEGRAHESYEHALKELEMARACGEGEIVARNRIALLMVITGRPGGSDQLAGMLSDITDSRNQQALHLNILGQLLLLNCYAPQFGGFRTQVKVYLKTHDDAFMYAVLSSIEQGCGF